MIWMGAAGILVNVALAVLNLMPLLPLDGGRIVVSLLPPRLAYRFSLLEPYGMVILLVLCSRGCWVSCCGPSSSAWSRALAH